MGGNPLSLVDPKGLNPAAVCLIPPVTGACVAGATAIGKGVTAIGATGIGLWAVLNKNQNEIKPKDCPSGTLGLDEAKKRFGWDNETGHKTSSCSQFTFKTVPPISVGVFIGKYP